MQKFDLTLHEVLPDGSEEFRSYIERDLDHEAAMISIGYELLNRAVDEQIISSTITDDDLFPFFEYREKGKLYQVSVRASVFHQMASVIRKYDRTNIKQIPRVKQVLAKRIGKLWLN